MEGLIRHLVTPFVAHPDDVKVKVVEGDAAIILEMSVHDADRHLLTDEDGRTLRHVRTVLNAAAGSRKATLDLLDENAVGASEE